MPETETREQPRTGRQTKAAVEKVARSYFAAVAARDPDAIAAHWHAEGVDDMVPVRVLRGPGEVAEMFRELFTAFPDYEMTVEAITADTKSAAVQWRGRGTFSGGRFQGLEPTGRSFELRGIDRLVVEHGKLVSNVAVFDGTSMARGIGMLPPRDSGAEKAMYAAFNAGTKLRAALRDARSR